MEPSLLPYFDYSVSVIIRNFTTSSDYSISHHNVMDRFLKKRTATDSDPSSSSPHKKQKIPASAKQGDISAAWQAQEFGSHFYESGGKLFCKPYNTVVDHARKSVILKHIESKVRMYFDHVIFLHLYSVF